VIGLDTNALVRLLVADDPIQAAQVRNFIERHCSTETPGFIGCVVLAETVWVLESVYGMDRTDIARVVEQLLATPELLLQDHALVRASLDAFAKSSIGFTDMLIAEINRANGCDTTATFDRKAAKFDGFTLVR
jgi:predicted nucleic-acid-binding protein